MHMFERHYVILHHRNYKTIHILIVQGANSTSTRFETSIGIDTILESLGVNVITKCLHARGKCFGIRLHVTQVTQNIHRQHWSLHFYHQPSNHQSCKIGKKKCCTNIQITVTSSGQTRRNQNVCRLADQVFVLLEMNKKNIFSYNVATKVVPSVLRKISITMVSIAYVSHGRGKSQSIVKCQGKTNQSDEQQGSHLVCEKVEHKKTTIQTSATKIRNNSKLFYSVLFGECIQRIFQTKHVW